MTLCTHHTITLCRHHTVHPSHYHTVQTSHCAPITLCTHHTITLCTHHTVHPSHCTHITLSLCAPITLCTHHTVHTSHWRDRRYRGGISKLLHEIYLCINFFNDSVTGIEDKGIIRYAGLLLSVNPFADSVAPEEHHVRLAL